MKKTIFFLIISVTFLAVPFLAFAQYYGYDNYGYDSYSNYNYNSYPSYNTGYNGYSGNWYDYTYDSPSNYNSYNYSYPSYNTGYNNGYYGNWYDYTYDSPSNYNNYNYNYPDYNYGYNNYDYNNGYNNNNYNYNGYNNYNYNNGYSNCSYYGCNYQNQCTSNSYKSCSGNSLYWFNSCGSMGSLASECGTTGLTGNKKCNGNWVQQEKTVRGCSGNSCYANSTWENVENCSTNGRTCSNGSCSQQNNLTVSCNIYQTNANVGDSIVFSANIWGGTGSYSYSWSGDCTSSDRECRTSFQSTGSKTATITVHSNGQTASAVCSINISNQNGWYVNSYLSCYDNDLYWYDRYNNRISKQTDCQANQNCTYGTPYCNGNSVYRQKTCQTGSCINNACVFSTNSTQTEYVETCGYRQVCNAGNCYSPVY